MVSLELLVEIALPYRYCIVAIGVMVFAVTVWFFWRIVFPRVFGYKLVRTKEILSDGTVVTVVCALLYFWITID